MHPPPLRHLYPRLTSFASLHAAARRAQRGKRYRPAVLAFNANLEAQLLQLQHELRAFSYRPGPYRQFRIRDPKPRLISAAPYRDRVVHHALCGAIVPPLERHFHKGSHANRLGYGSHRALHRFTAAAARHRWVLQADIRLYFPSIDLTILRAQLAAAIACPGTLWLLDQILANGATFGPALDTFPGDTLLTPLERPRGLPIGNLTSQFLANLHLNDLDHTLSALPGVHVYLRYVDDLALFADHPEPLQRARACLDQHLEALRLRAHPIKTQLRRCRDGASFVGFVVRPGLLRVRNHNLRSGRRRLKLPTWPMATPGACGGACMQTCPTPATYPDPGRVAQLLRGGSWNNNPRNCRSAYRNHNEPDNANNNIGFRVVCLPQHPSPSEPLEGIPAGAPEGSRPVPVIHQLSWWIRTAPEGAPVVHGLTIDVGSAPFFSLPNAVHAHLAELKP